MECWGDDDLNAAVQDVQAGLGAGWRLGSLSVGMDHACALALRLPQDAQAAAADGQGGEAVCWGSNWMNPDLAEAVFTTLAEGERMYAGKAAPPAARFAQVAAGAEHSCGVTVQGELMCWGRGIDGGSLADAGALACCARHTSAHTLTCSNALARVRLSDGGATSETGSTSGDDGGVGVLVV